MRMNNRSHNNTHHCRSLLLLLLLLLPLAVPSAPKTPLANASRLSATPPSDASLHSSRSSRVSVGCWDDDGESAALGVAGPRPRQIQMSKESRAWVESVKEKVRIASGERKALPSITSGGGDSSNDNEGLETSPMEGHAGARAMFGEMGKVGSTKRLFIKRG
ncbi:hypothetical protein VTK56DRAFT_6534 [Thermocarpiscus australiensis]